MVKQRVIAMLPRIFAIVAVVVILGAALGAGSALAAKGGIKGKPGGNGGNGHGGNGDNGSATLVLAPDPVAAYDEYVVTGSGFTPNAFVSVGVKHPDATYWTTVMTDGDGAFSFTKTAKGPGEVIHEAYQQKSKRCWEMKASATLTVVP